MPAVACPRCRTPVERSGSDPVLVACPQCRTSLREAETLSLPEGPRSTGEGEPLPPPGSRETLPLPTHPASEAATLPPPATAPGMQTVPVTRLPNQIGRFVIEAKLGEGAFGVVYKAHDPVLDRKVALKVAKPGALDTSEKVQRFLREAKSAANLTHPYIVTLHESGRDCDYYFIVSTFIEGRTLADELEASDGPLSPTRAAEIGFKLASALGYAHGEKIVHRDVKPANIMLNAKSDPLLMDFGLAARPDDAKLSQDGSAMGTPAYMAPEQAIGNGIAASDQYSLGCTLFELLTGQTPFSGTPGHQIFLHQTEPPPSPRTANAAVPRDLDTVVRKCLAKTPAERYGTCGDLAEDLRRWSVGEPVTARRVGPVERFAKWARRNPAITASLSLAFLAMITGTAISLWQADVAAGEADNAVRAAKRESEQRQLADGEAEKARYEAKRADGEAEKAVREAKETRRLLDLVRLQTAQAAWDKNLLEVARTTLDQIAPENRCIAWGLLHKRFHGLFVLLGHTTDVTSVCFSPDGSRIATGAGRQGQPGEVRVWDARTGQFLFVLRGHTAGVRSVSFSLDGTRLASGSAGGIGQPCETRIWDARTGEALFELPEPSGGVRCVCFSPDGARIATGSEDQKNRRGKARVWDARTGKQLFEIPDHRGDVTCVCFSPDGARIAVASGFGVAYVWDTATKKSVAEFKASNYAVATLCFSPDGSRIATASPSHQDAAGSTLARVWDARTGTPLLELRGHRFEIASVCYSPDGSRIATGAADKTARVWDARTGQSLVEIHGHTDAVSSVCFSPDGVRIATGSHDGTAALWDARTGEAVREVPRFADTLATVRPDWSKIAADGIESQTRPAGRLPVELPNRTRDSACYSPDGSLLASTTKNGASIWDARTGKLILELKGESDSGWSGRGICFSPNGLNLATGSFGRNPRVWNIQTGKVAFELQGHAHGVNGVAFSPDGSRIATGSIDKTVRVWDARTGQALLELQGHTNDVYSVCFTPDGLRIASGSADGTLRLWDAATGQPLLTLADARPVESVCFSPDGLQMAAGSWDETFRVWDGRTDANRVEFQGHTRAVSSVSCAPDGLRIVTGSVDKTVRLWDSRIRESLLEMRGHKDAIDLVSFSPEGRWIASRARGTIRVWDARTGQVQSEIEGSIHPLAFSSDGLQIVTGSTMGTATLWDVRTGRPIHQLEGHTSGIGSLGFSPDGSCIATGSEDHTARIWDAVSGRSLFVLPGHKEAVDSVCFSPDGTKLATCSGTFKVGQLRLWDARNGQLVYEVFGDEGHIGGARIQTVRFSANGSIIQTKSDREMLAWDAETGRQILHDSLPAIPETDASPDVQYRYLAYGKRVLRVPRVIPVEERRRRFVQTRALPELHRHAAKRFAEERNAFAAEVHRSLEQLAVGQQLIEVGEILTGFWHLVVAEILRPKPGPSP